jgi:8-hydroxy-5-deazaflavin:NADPH oxidoreductase
MCRCFFNQKILNMKIAIIGSGNIGSVLAKGIAKHTHEIVFGLRNTNDANAEELAKQFRNISVASVADAAKQSDVIIIAVPYSAVPDAAKSLGDVKGKIIIETTNPFGKSLVEYENSVAAIKDITGVEDVVKCFNSIGAESLANPQFDTFVADGFVAGNSIKAKEVAISLSNDMGFANCFDLGGDDAVHIVESIAQLCMALAYNAKMGRRVAFKVLH